MAKWGTNRRLSTLLTASLACFTAGILALAVMAYFAVDRLDQQVGRWGAMASIDRARAAVLQAVDAYAKAPAAASSERVNSAFDALARTLTRGPLEEMVTRLGPNAEEARAAFGAAWLARQRAVSAQLVLRRSVSEIAGVLSDELAEARRKGSASARKSQALEAANRQRLADQRALMDVLSQIDDVRSRIAQINALAGRDLLPSTDQFGISLAWIPTACDDVSAPDRRPIVCTLSPARLRAAVAAMETARDAPTLKTLSGIALIAADAYQRGTMRQFDAKSGELSTSLRATIEEREATQALRERERSLARVNSFLISLSAASEQLDIAPLASIAGLDARARAMLKQLRFRSRALLGTTTAESIDALERAWEHAAGAAFERHERKATMQSALADMSQSIALEERAVSESSERSIAVFGRSTLATFVGLSLFVLLLMIVAQRLIVRPIGSVTDNVLALADGRFATELRGLPKGQVWGRLADALETLRSVSLAKSVVEAREAAATAALRSAHGRLSRIANDAPAALFELQQADDGTLTLPYRSDVFDTLFGMEPGHGEIRIDAALAHVHPDDRARIVEAIGRSAETHDAWKLRFRVTRGEGATAWLMAQAAPARDADGLACWVGSVSDVSREVRREAELDTARLRAEAANEAKSAFLANISHELRTPMNGIVGMTELLNETALDAEQRLCTRTITTSAMALLTVINDVLDFSKIEAGREELDLAPFSLIDLTYEVGELLMTGAHQKGFRLLLEHLPGAPVEVRGDSARVRRVLLNVVGNAIKFTRRGFVSLTLEGHPLGALVTVRDTGIGIPAEKLDSIFDAFHQVDNALTREHDGSGLGLAITKGLIELMGGSIAVESEVGAGTVFRIVLPFGRPIGRVGADAAPGAALAGRRLLVVDDLPEARRILAAQLSRLGAEVTVLPAEDQATEALAEAVLQRAGEVDRVVIDADLTERSVDDLVCAITRARRTDRPPLLLHATIGTAVDRARLQRLGIDDILVKPAPPAQLAAILGARRPVPRPSRGPVPPVTEAQPVSSMAAGAGPEWPLVYAAEDNRVNQIVLRKMAEKLPVELRIFANGQLLLDAFVAAQPALVLMDMSMPVMAGEEAARRIRAHEAAAGLAPCPIIAVTANAAVEHREACLAAGMTAYLSKPLRKDALEATLAAHLPARTRPADEPQVALDHGAGAAVRAR
ncbi:MAG: ATP-binding protein [Pseudomonadota bacterium]